MSFFAELRRSILAALDQLETGGLSDESRGHVLRGLEADLAELRREIKGDRRKQRHELRSLLSGSVVRMTRLIR